MTPTDSDAMPSAVCPRSELWLWLPAPPTVHESPGLSEQSSSDMRPAAMSMARRCVCQPCTSTKPESAMNELLCRTLPENTNKFGVTSGATCLLINECDYVPNQCNSQANVTLPLSWNGCAVGSKHQAMTGELPSSYLS